jgi:hypothetical protein
LVTAEEAMDYDAETTARRVPPSPTDPGPGSAPPPPASGSDTAAAPPSSSSDGGTGELIGQEQVSQIWVEYYKHRERNQVDDMRKLLHDLSGCQEAVPCTKHSVKDVRAADFNKLMGCIRTLGNSAPNASNKKEKGFDSFN